MYKKLKGMDRANLIYFVILSFTALGLGLSNSVLSNYFKEVYNVTAYQRGLIEFPRELPGVLTIFVITALSCFSDFRISMIAQLLGIIGIFSLGFLTPPFAVMLVFIFINSMGMHMFMPLRDSIGISLIKSENFGHRMGQYKSVSTGFAMLASIMVFIGFKTGFFNFETKIKWIFVISAILLSVVLLLMLLLEKTVGTPVKTEKKMKFIFRKEYKYYYMLVIMFGVQKQIMMVYGPWVLIDILSKKADTIAILMVIGSFIGIFFIPRVGKWIDKFGVKKMLYADALSFIGVYFVYGVISYGFTKGNLATVGIPVLIAYSLIIFDTMSNQMGMIRTIYLKSIVVKTSDIMPTLSLGLSFDHMVSIVCAYLGGIIWTVWGPHYLFFLIAGLSLVNVYVATKVKEEDLNLNRKIS